MENNSNILLITDDKEMSESFAARLALLRTDDKIVVSAFDNAAEVLENSYFNAVILDENPNNEITLDLIKCIKTNCPSTSIILLVNDVQDDFVLTAYDSGITDYCLVNSNTAEILIKTINSLKKSTNAIRDNRNSLLLQQFSLMSPFSGFYTEKAAEEVINVALEADSFRGGTFMILTFDEIDKAKFVPELLSNALKNSIRVNDVVAEMKSGKYYILLDNADENGAETVFEKIKTNLAGEFKLKAGVCSVKNEKFEGLEKKASIALTEAMLSDLEMAFKSGAKEDEVWLDFSQNEEKNYKLFKQTFSKKLEKVIAPVFYRLQKTYEDKIIGTKIEQYTDETRSVFRLKSQFQNSKLIIIYPGLAKVIICITHEGLDSPENKEIPIPLNKICQKDFSRILEDFINDYKSVVEKLI